MQEDKLIFIISQPRAGSTLLQKLLSNNELVDTVSEPWLLLPLLSIYKPELIDARYNYKLAMDGFFDYLGKKNSSLEFKNNLKQLILGLYKVSNSNQYFIDKTPRNYEIIPLIMEFFPTAKFIVLKRNPFASLHSMLAIWSNGKLHSLKTFYRDFLIAPQLIQEFCDTHGKKTNVKEVYYENILSDPKNKTKEIYDWLNIPFDEHVLDLGKNEKIAGLFGDDAQKEQPLKTINSDLKDSWKDQLGDKSVAAFFSLYQNYLSSEFLKKYGYENAFPAGNESEFKISTNANGDQKLPQRNLIKRAIHSSFNSLGLEIRKICKSGSDLSPGQVARNAMSACIADLRRDQKK